MKTKIYFHNGIETNYTINTYGEIKNRTSGKVIKPKISVRGYLRIGIYILGKREELSVHRMVACTFLGNEYTNKLQVNHIDGNKLNNHVNNLEWVSPSKNIKHAFDIGLKDALRGDNNPSTKYPDKLIKKMCSYLNEGKTIPETSKLVNIPVSYIYAIVRDDNYIRNSVVNEYLDRNKLVYTNKSYNISKDMKEKIKNMYKNGYTAKEIQQELNIPSVHPIYRIVNREKIYKIKSSTTKENIDNEYYTILINL